MCAIAGVFSFERRIDDPERLARGLADALAHRGPDGEGIWLSSDADTVLAHRRLAIIDLSPGGAQPMATRDGRYRIVFNGEIYNYRELRRELEQGGEPFATASDTEVLLRLLVCHGPSGLARARGMFALGLWDSVQRSLLLARDRFGIKPLYVAESPGAIAFASEIRALVSVGLAGGAVDPAGVLAYLAWGSVPPPLTWTTGVEAVAPGSWLRCTRDGRDRGTFADVDAAYAGTGDAASEADFRERVHLAVERSVAAHLVADVPVGLFLSGGIDSSSVLSAATSVGAVGIQTYTVRFEGANSEHEHARTVAAAFGAEHHELVVDGARVAEDLPGVLARLDQPTIDAVNAFYVSRAVAATGVKAVLSGTGGDEMFGGYPSFRRLPTAVRLKHRLGPMFPVLAPVVGRLLPDRLSARWQQFASANGRVESSYRAQRGLFMPAELEAIAGPRLRDGTKMRETAARVAATEAALLGGAPSATLEGDVARLETRLYLGSQLLRDLDAMSMAHGLEVRLPFVDHVLLAAVWPDLGAYPSIMRNKRLLHETLARRLPPSAVHRPKQGFTLPFARWIGAELRPFVRDGLASLADAGWIGRHVPEAVWKGWADGAMHWSRIWSLGMLGAFLRTR